MNAIYLDTNIFVYSSQVTSPFFSKCNNFIEYSVINNIDLATSTESIQEIVHLAKKIKKVAAGLKTSNILLKPAKPGRPVDKETSLLRLDRRKKNSHLRRVES